LRVFWLWRLRNLEVGTEGQILRNARLPADVVGRS
jgi:hypothetical protein